MTTRRAAVTAALMAAGLLLCSCWIPLPTETALLVEVLDEAGNPVGNVPVVLDDATYYTASDGNRQGQVFRSFTGSAGHTVAVDLLGLADPQGGNPLVARAAMVSGENVPLSAASRPFFLNTPLHVPVVTGNITKVTVFLAELYLSPRDNQWLTDGSDPSPFRDGDGSREFADQPLPTFAWREEPSLAGTTTGLVDFTFQLWEDPDGDIRYPLGVKDVAGYARTVVGLPADWEVPHSGLQRARAPVENNGKVFLWASPAQDASTPIAYDVYYAQAAHWSTNDTMWEDKPVMRDAAWSIDGGARYFEVGPGTANPVVLKAGVPYRFGLRARDAVANLDTIGCTTTRVAVPDGGSSLTWNATAANTWAIAETGGTITFQVAAPSTAASCRIYLVPEGDFSARPFGERFRHETISTFGSPVSIGAGGIGDRLVNGLTYTVGIEPIDSTGNRPASGGTLRTVAVQVPPAKAAYVDTIAPILPVTPLVGAVQAGTGSVTLYFDGASDETALGDYRVYLAPSGVPVPSDLEGYPHQDLPPDAGGFGYDSSITVTGLVNGVPYQFHLAALDRSGNRAVYTDPFPITLADAGDADGPVWDSADASVFTSIAWAYAGSPGSHRLLGWTCDYRGFALRRRPRNTSDPASGPGGEYVWRVVQESRDFAGQTLAGKLAAFYAYSGYYFRSGYSNDPTAALQMTSLSGAVRHSDTWSFLWRRLAAYANRSASSGTVGVMNAYLASAFAIPSQYRQRTENDFLIAQRDNSRASSVNQIAVFYRTDVDGKAVASGGLSGSYTTFLDVVLTNRAVTNPQGAPYIASQNPGDPPYLSSKRFGLIYNYNTTGVSGWTSDSLVKDPLFPVTEGIYFDGQRLVPDLSLLSGYPWQDPAW